MVAVPPAGSPIELLHSQAMGQLRREGAAGFPWRRPCCQDIDLAAEDDPSCLQSPGVNCVVVLDPGSEATEETRAQCAAAAAAHPGFAYRYYHGGLEGEMASFLLQDVLGQPSLAQGEGCTYILALGAVPPYYKRLPEGRPRVTVAEFVALSESGGLEMIPVAQPAEDEEDEEDEEDDA